MKSFTSDSRMMALTATAGVFAALLLSQIARPYTPGEPEITAPSAVAPSTHDATNSGFEQPTFDAFPSILDRPLFFPGRTLPPEPAVEKPAPLSPLRLALEGIAIVGDAKIAVLKDLGDNRLLRLSAGDSHDGWTLESVSATSATFRRDGERTVLSLNTAR